MARIRITGDSKRWDFKVNAKFRDFQRLSKVSADKVSAGMDAEIEALVRSRLDRPENKSRGTRAGKRGTLADAYRKSVQSFEMDRDRLGVGVRIADPKILSAIAAYWHVLEVGGLQSGHFAAVANGKVLLWGFGVRSGPSGFSPSPPIAPDGAKFRQSPDAMPINKGFGQAGSPITKPIEPHGYLGEISRRVINRFEKRILNDMKRAFDQ